MRTRIDPHLAATALAGVVLVGLFVAERRRPLRAKRDRDPSRIARSVALGALSLAVVRIFERPIVDPLAERVARKRLGPIQQLPEGVRAPVAALALDYTLYLWHRLAHRWPPLWRFHRAHHADLDLDVTTAMRFHAGEMALSTLWRLAQVRLLGIGPKELFWWRTLSLPLILFHHANLRLPPAIERALGGLVTTPAHHGVHHSAVQAERDSNWSSGLIIWDKLHGTFRDPPAHEDLVIGDEVIRRPLTLKELFLIPIERRPSDQGSTAGEAG